MRQLCDLGYRMAVKGYPWAKTPPGFVPQESIVPQKAVVMPPSSIPIPPARRP